MQVQPRLSRLALASFLALLGTAPGVMAAPILTATSAATAANAAAVTPTSFTAPGYESSQSQASEPSTGTLVGTGSGRSFANAAGAYYVGSTAAGIGTGNALASFATSFTNTTGITQLYSLQFHIYGGRILTDLVSGQTLDSSESLRSSYAATLKVNDVSVWNSSATLTRTSGGISLTKSGVDLNSGDNGSSGFYGWGDGYYTVELGAFGDGAVINVEAIVEDEAYANVGTYVVPEGGGYCYGGGYGNTRAATGNRCFKGSAEASYGDPLVITGTGTDPTLPGGQAPFVPTLTPANAVPEPGSLALAALALATVGAVRRRRRKPS